MYRQHSFVLDSMIWRVRDEQIGSESYILIMSIHRDMITYVCSRLDTPS